MVLRREGVGGLGPEHMENVCWSARPLRLVHQLVSDLDLGKGDAVLRTIVTEIKTQELALIKKCRQYTMPVLIKAKDGMHVWLNLVCACVCVCF